MTIAALSLANTGVARAATHTHPHRPAPAHVRPARQSVAVMPRARSAAPDSRQILRLS
jgi:hypothetical protein